MTTHQIKSIARHPFNQNVLGTQITIIYHSHIGHANQLLNVITKSLSYMNSSSNNLKSLPQPYPLSTELKFKGFTIWLVAIEYLALCVTTVVFA